MIQNWRSTWTPVACLIAWLISVWLDSGAKYSNQPIQSLSSAIGVHQESCASRLLDLQAITKAFAIGWLAAANCPCPFAVGSLVVPILLWFWGFECLPSMSFSGCPFCAMWHCMRLVAVFGSGTFWLLSDAISLWQPVVGLHHSGLIKLLLSHCVLMALCCVMVEWLACPVVIAIIGGCFSWVPCFVGL